MLEKSTYYILDAQGQQLSMYEHVVDSSVVKYHLAERNIYGSSRLGVTKDTLNLYNPNSLPSYCVLGNRNYELNNHLGNVLTVINDQVFPLDTNNDMAVDAYQVGIDNTFDYSPFGVQLDGRTIAKDYSYLIDTTITVLDDTTYSSNFILSQNTMPDFDGWWGNITTTALHVINQNNNFVLKINSSNSQHGANRYFDVIENQTYNIEFNLNLNNLSNTNFTVYNVDELGNESILYSSSLTQSQVYNFNITPTENRILVKIHQNGIFYMDDFKLNAVITDTLYASDFENPVVIEPNIHGWTFNMGTTLGWQNYTTLNARYGELKKIIVGLSSGLYTASLYINLGSNSSVKLKIYGKNNTGNLISLNNVNVTTSGNASISFTQPAVVYNTIIFAVEPVGNNEFYIDNYVLKKLNIPNPITIESNDFNLDSIFVNTGIDGWKINTKTDRIATKPLFGSKQLVPMSKTSQVFSTISGKEYNFNFSVRVYNSGGPINTFSNNATPATNLINPAIVLSNAKLNVKIYDVASNTLLSETNYTSTSNPTISFVATGNQIRIEFNSIILAVNYAICIDNVSLKTTGLNTIYATNFSGITVTQPGLDGWMCDLAAGAYLTVDAPSGQEERLIILEGDLANGANQTFNVIPGYQYTLNYALDFLAPGTMNLSITDAATIATDTKTVAGNYSLSFIPNSTTATIHFGANSAVALHHIQISYHHLDTLITQPRRGGYRYQFMGYEVDNEPKGNGNSYTTEFRQYDPRLSRWLSLDPLMAKFPNQSPYASFNNNPMRFTDRNGLEGQDWVRGKDNKWNYHSDVKNEEQARAKYGDNFAEYAKAGHEYNAVGGRRVRLGNSQSDWSYVDKNENGNYTNQQGMDIQWSGEDEANMEFKMEMKGLANALDNLKIGMGAIIAAPLAVEGIAVAAPAIVPAISSGGKFAFAGRLAFNYTSEFISSGSLNPLDHNAISYPLGLVISGISIQKQMLIGGSSGLVEYKISNNQLNGFWNLNPATTTLKVINGATSPIFGNWYGGIIRQGIGGNAIDKLNTHIEDE